MSLLNATTSSHVDHVTMTSPAVGPELIVPVDGVEANCSPSTGSSSTGSSSTGSPPPGGAETLEVVSQLVHGTIIPLLAGVGIVLNCLNLAVLSSGRLNESSYTYLTGLAVADGLTLSLFLANGIGRGHYPNSVGWRRFEAYVYFPVGFATTTAGLLLTVTVSAERYAFIREPIRARRWCNRRTARALTAAIWSFCVATNAPRFFVFAVDRRLGRLEYTTFGRGRLYATMSWFHLLAMSCGCGLALAVINVLLVRGLRRTAERRLGGGQRQRRRRRRSGGGVVPQVRRRADDQRRLTRTLVSIVTVYLLGEIPSALTSRALISALSGDPCLAETDAFRITSLVTTVLIVLQLSANFVLYCVLNRRFWAVFTERFGRCARHRPPRLVVNDNNNDLDNDHDNDRRRRHHHQQQQQQQQQQQPQQLTTTAAAHHDHDNDHHHANDNNNDRTSPADGLMP